MGATKPEKKEKKEKKRSEADGVGKVKKDKKEKKEKKEKLKSAVTAALDEEKADVPVSVAEKEEASETATTTKAKPVLVGSLVPFARPLADEKATKKIMKSVRKGMPARRPVRPNSQHLPSFPIFSYKFPNRYLTNTMFSPHNSRKEQDPEARRQRSRKIPT